MAITTRTLVAAARRASQRAASIEDELNAADGKLGDGDTGVMLRRLFATIVDAAPADEPDLGAVFRTIAKACSGATGSSLGTLVTVAMLTLAKELGGRTEASYGELGRLLGLVRDAMLGRGGAALGDKTVIDALDAAASAITGLNDPAEIAAAARIRVTASLDEFRHRPNRIGRARMFAERSIGLDDPGMLAFARLLDAVAEA